mmetsp:Transcript_14803/g.28186  ORF Transcript_14803/g.28186 Transcript_14803/m.28186 type:complete len:210 (+) Transcript_14803:324-953(+)
MPDSVPPVHGKRFMRLVPIMASLFLLLFLRNHVCIEINKVSMLRMLGEHRFMDLHASRRVCRQISHLQSQSRDTTNTNAFSKPQGDHSCNGGRKRENIHFLHRIAVFEFGWVQHANPCRDEHSRKSRHGDHGNAASQKNNTAKDKAGLYQGRQTCFGIQAHVKTRSGNNRRDGHSHEHSCRNIGHALPDEFLIGTILVGSFLHFIQSRA